MNPRSSTQATTLLPRHVACWLVLALGSAWSGCKNDDPAPTPPQSAQREASSAASEQAPKANPESAPEPPRVQGSRRMMGTLVQITVLSADEARANTAIEAAFAEMDRLEQLLSEWRTGSEVSRINEAAGVKAVSVSPETLENVRVGLEVARWSDGAFDISWAALRDLYLFQPGDERVPTTEQLAARLPLVDYRNVVLDDRAQSVFLKKKGMRLGLGGIAKGYALDRAASVLERAGFGNYMIFGGGQVLVKGLKGERPFRVGIQHPRKQDYFGFLEATSGSITTSGDYEHAFVKDGKRWHHILDLRTGLPVAHTASVTVVGESGFYTDAVGTALFIMGAEKALAKLPTAPGPPMQAVIVDADLRLHMSPGMAERVKLRPEVRDGKLP